MNRRQRLTIGRHFLAARWRWRALRGPALEAFQDRRTRRIVQWAAQRAVFYRRHWAGCDLERWGELPPVDKRLMMDNFDTFNTVGITRAAALDAALAAERSRDFRPVVDGITVGLSSGTSGHRGLFLVSPQEQAAWAGVILARALHRIDLRGTRVAFFLRANSNLYEQTDGFLIQLRYFDLMLPLEEAIAALNGYRPHLVVGPPLLLGMLGEAQLQGRLRIRPHRLISVAEVLEPQDRRRLEEVFGAPVHQIYQSTEGLLAVSCPAGALHLQEDIVAVQLECLDTTDATRFSPIVTDLWRTTQPIVRYRLNDVLRMAGEPCRCGSPWRVIAAIEGRADDICYFIGPAGELRPFYPDTVRRMVLLAAEPILDYQAFQERAGQLRIHLAVAPGSDFGAVARTVVEQVASVVASYDCRAPAVSVELGLVPLAPGAKRRRVQRLWQP